MAYRIWFNQTKFGYILTKIACNLASKYNHSKCTHFKTWEIVISTDCHLILCISAHWGASQGQVGLNQRPHPVFLPAKKEEEFKRSYLVEKIAYFLLHLRKTLCNIFHLMNLHLTCCLFNLINVWRNSCLFSNLENGITSTLLCPALT